MHWLLSNTTVHTTLHVDICTCYDIALVLSMHRNATFLFMLAMVLESLGGWVVLFHTILTPNFVTTYYWHICIYCTIAFVVVVNGLRGLQFR